MYLHGTSVWVRTRCWGHTVSYHVSNLVIIWDVAGAPPCWVICGIERASPFSSYFGVREV